VGQAEFLIHARETKMMIMSHPFKPLEKIILVGNEIQEMIEASIDIAEKLWQACVSICHKSLLIFI
jgi:hypothetical protein